MIPKHHYVHTDITHKFTTEATLTFDPDSHFVNFFKQGGRMLFKVEAVGRSLIHDERTLEYLLDGIGRIELDAHNTISRGRGTGTTKGMLDIENNKIELYHSHVNMSKKFKQAVRLFSFSTGDTVNLKFEISNFTKQIKNQVCISQKVPVHLDPIKFTLS